MKKLETMNTGELFTELIYAGERVSYYALLASLGGSEQHHAAAQKYAARRDAAYAEIGKRGINVRSSFGIPLPAELFND